jgi:uncharacterized protein
MWEVDMTPGSPVFRKNGISYLEIPAKDVRRSADFYEKVFEWKLSGNPTNPSFSDGTGHVIGHWKEELPVAGTAGVIPYIFVDSVHDSLEKVRANGGEIVKSAYPEGDLLVAIFRDPAGNVFGIWQRA